MTDTPTGSLADFNAFRSRMPLAKRTSFSVSAGGGSPVVSNEFEVNTIV